MKKGLVHIYCGDGKGKTTCAMGLAIRAAGRGLPVCIVQFMKSADSGEREILKRIPNVTLVEIPEKIKFFFAMNDDEKNKAAEDFSSYLETAKQFAEDNPECLIIFDELCSAVSCALLSVTEVTDFLKNRPESCEVVMTGRDPHPELQAIADYITEMKKEKHPFDQGIPARIGVEY